MSKNIIPTLATFSPGELERSTGLTTSMQRDWRRRGFIPPSPFDCFSLAETLVLKLLADRGIGPQSAKDVAGICAQGIVWHALEDIEAAEGDLDRVLDGVPQDQLDRHAAATQALVDAAAEAVHVEVGPLPDPLWSLKAQIVRQVVWSARKLPRVRPAPFFIWWADGSHVWHVSLDRAFSEASTGDPRFAGPAVVLDLKALAWTLQERAGRPFVHIECYEEDGAEAVPSDTVGAAG